MTSATAVSGKPNRKQRKQLRAQSRIAYRKAQREAKNNGESDIHLQTEQQRRERKIFDQLVRLAIAKRMCQRFYGAIVPDPICLDYRYWQARKCGWNALEGQCAGLWSWWILLHWKTRQHLVDMSGYRLLRGQDVTRRKDMQAYLSRIW